MPKDEVKARLAPIPVFTVANPKNEFVLVAGEVGWGRLRFLRGGRFARPAAAGLAWAHPWRGLSCLAYHRQLRPKQGRQGARRGPGPGLVLTRRLPSAERRARSARPRPRVAPSPKPRRQRPAFASARLPARPQNNTQLGFFFFRKEDAEAIIEKVGL
jgi:hypothetical protein